MVPNTATSTPNEPPLLTEQGLPWGRGSNPTARITRHHVEGRQMLTPERQCLREGLTLIGALCSSVVIAAVL